MKVVHIESGLGNQMLSYCEYLALKHQNPADDIYIETIIYDIQESNDVICQWNGFELERIFNIKSPNVRELFTEEKWDEIILDIRASKFWEKNWNYPVWFVQAFEKAGVKLLNIRGDFEDPKFVMKFSEEKTVKKRIIDSKIGDTLKRWFYYIQRKKKLQQVNNTKNLFYDENIDVFTGQWLSFKLLSNNIEEIDYTIRETFRFPTIKDEKNSKMATILKESNSIAIHARRGDMLNFNGNCYKYGYFQRAVKYMKKNVKEPIFIFFCDPGSVEWCKENADIFSLNFNKDKVIFVDWNKGEESFRDMQLMSLCKHAIITNSSFGWWGAYLIENPDKITISPDITINTTNHC